MSEIVGLNILILGYGREGESVYNYLKNNYPNLKIKIADEKNDKNYLKNLRDCDLVIRSPGVRVNLPQIKKYLDKGGKMTSATNIFFSICKGKTIGVTGTKGKSTTASLIYDILKRKYKDVRLVGNIGKPALDFIANSTEETIFILELSSFQLEDLRYSPNLAVILAIYPEHLDYHETFEQYLSAKTNIIKYQNENDTVIFNPKNELAKKIAYQSKAKKTPFVQKKFDKTFLTGSGSFDNVLAAFTVGVTLAVNKDDIKAAIKKFKPLEHRLEFIGEFKGIRFYNDSLATIPEAVINAIEALEEDVETLILGGYDRGLDFSKLGKFLSKKKIKNLILFPTTGTKIWQALLNSQNSGKLLPTKYEVSSMDKAVKMAFKVTPPGKICLLSPGSSSFGLFKSYQERGNQFKKLVKAFSSNN